MLPLLNELRQKDFVENVYPFGEYHHVVVKNSSGENSLDQFIREHTGGAAKKVDPDIEDCFIALMKN
jgi:hypothetical protein